MSKKRTLSARGVSAALTKGGWKPKPSLSYVDGGVSVSANIHNRNIVHVRCHTNESAADKIRAILGAYATETGATLVACHSNSSWRRLLDSEPGTVTIITLSLPDADLSPCQEAK